MSSADMQICVPFCFIKFNSCRTFSNESRFILFFFQRKMFIFTIDDAEPFKIDGYVLQKKEDIVHYLVNHDDEPVPVLTQRPELFVLFNMFWLSIWRCKCETRADCVSPINTSFNARYGRMRLTRARYFFWSCSLRISVGYSLSSIGFGSSSCRSKPLGRLPFWPSIVVRIRVRCNHSNSPCVKDVIFISFKCGGHSERQSERASEPERERGCLPWLIFLPHLVVYSNSVWTALNVPRTDLDRNWSQRLAFDCKISDMHDLPLAKMFHHRRLAQRYQPIPFVLLSASLYKIRITN